MAPNDYYPNYYSANNPGHQNQHQAYSRYQTQRSNAGQPPSRQYQQGQNISLTQSTDYMPYPTQPYTEQRAYEAQQDGSWASNFGGSNETTSRTAEALSLSSTAYASGTSVAVSSPGFTPTNAATSSQYATAVPQSQQTQSSYDSRMSSHSTIASHGEDQARPRSVNSISSTRTQTSTRNQKLPSSASTTTHSTQKTQAIFNQQRSASPAEIHYLQDASTHGTSKILTSVPSSAQYNDYSRRPLPIVTEPPRAASVTTLSTSYNYGEGNLPDMTGQATNTNGVGNQYDQSTATVDPMQVYDPRPEYQRKQDAVRSAKAAEVAAQTEETRKPEETKRLEEARKAKEQKKLEEERRAREAQISVPVAATETTSRQTNSTKLMSSKKSTAPEASTSDSNAGPSSSGDPALEAEIRAMMAKMRELNKKDPALLARIWEQERRIHIARQSLLAQNRWTPQPAAQTVQKNAPGMLAGGVNLGANQKLLVVNGSGIGPKPLQPPNAAHRSQIQAQAPPNPVTQTPAQHAAVPAPPTRQQGSTIWPPEKKAELAAAASKWLNSLPQNKEKQTTSDQIRSMLDSNPSYTGLCEMLEHMGLKLDRAAFARVLLAAIPDENSASRQPNQTQGQSSARASTERPPLANAYPNGTVVGSMIARSDNMPRKDDPPTQSKLKNENAFQGSGSVAGLNNPQQSPLVSQYPRPQAPAVQSPYFSTNYSPFLNSTRTGSHTPASIAQTTANGKNQSLRPTPKPASKEEAARKRNFSEVVDLTGFSDDDAIPPSQKKQQLDHESSHAPPVGSVPSSAMQPYAPSRRFGPFQYNPVAIPQPPLITHVPLPVPAVNDHIRSLDVVKPIDKRKALRRSTYDIKTIARDVLLATGKHPEMRPLNAHLEILKNSFDKVDGTSDLSTFRWDLVDPGEPPKGYLQNNMFEHEVDDADDEEDSGDDQAPTPARPRAIVRQAVGAGGDSQASDHTSAALMNGPVKGVPKWRGRPPQSSFSMASRPSGFGDGEPPNPRTNQTPNRPSEGQRDYSSRPVGSGQNQAPQSTGSGSTPTATSSEPRPSGSGIGYAAFRSTHAPDGTPLPKKKGRPVGWRKHIHGSPEAQASVVSRSRPPQPSGLRNVTTPANNPVVVIDSRSPSVTRGPSSGKMQSRKDSEPHYSVYKCHWKDCTAELHNLETLKKHVHKIHGKPAAHGGYDCLWANCGKEVTTIDKRTGIQVETHQYFDFPNEAKWREHLELKHFGPLAWTLGDGPASGLSDAHDSEAYLSDSYGRRVTPQISAPIQQESSSAAYLAGSSRAVPELGVIRRGRPPRESQEQVAQDAERAMVKKKQEIGPGVDRGGARLATEKRRLGFNDDEDFDEEIVDMEDD